MKKYLKIFLLVFVLLAVLAACFGSAEESENSNSSNVTEAPEVEETETVLETLDCTPKDVRNDTTGNWKVCTVATTLAPEEYAVDYYNKYIKDNPSEIHAIVNFTNKTTTKLSKMGNLIDVATYEYVDGEEHDANALYSGTLLSEEAIDPETGEVEKLQ